MRIQQIATRLQHSCRQSVLYMPEKMPLLISCQSVLQQTLKYWISDHHKSILNLRETLVAV